MGYRKATLAFGAMLASVMLSPSAFSEDNVWEVYPASNPFASNFGSSAVFKNGYDEIAFSPVSAKGAIYVYAKYWESDIKVPSKLIAKITLADGRSGSTEIELKKSWKDWQGTMHIEYTLAFEDLNLFKEATSYELNFGDKIMYIPMAGFGAEIEQVLATTG